MPEKLVVTIRNEHPEDEEAVFRVNRRAFETDSEARLVDMLRQNAAPYISLVAEHNKRIIGNIVFTPVTLDEQKSLTMMGLAPMAVIPELQNSGVGTQLVQVGIERCRSLDADAIVVLGHPEFYARFEFKPASEFGLRSEYSVPEGVFRILELEENILSGITGIVRYHDVFKLV